MPIYEYSCPKCGVFEVLQKFSEEPLKECPTCLAAGDNSPVARLVSAAAFHLKGTGWYKTDYAGKSNGASSGNNGQKHSENGSEKKEKKEVKETAPPSAPSGNE